jgi:hypothetical protein
MTGAFRPTCLKGKNLRTFRKPGTSLSKVLRFPLVISTDRKEETAFICARDEHGRKRIETSKVIIA